MSSKFSSVVSLADSLFHREAGQLLNKTCFQVESEDGLQEHEPGSVLAGHLPFHLQWSQSWKTFSYLACIPHFLLFRDNKLIPFTSSHRHRRASRWKCGAWKPQFFPTCLSKWVVYTTDIQSVTWAQMKQMSPLLVAVETLTQTLGPVPLSYYTQSLALPLSLTNSPTATQLVHHFLFTLANFPTNVLFFWCFVLLSFTGNYSVSSCSVFLWG